MIFLEDGEGCLRGGGANATFNGKGSIPLKSLRRCGREGEDGGLIRWYTVTFKMDPQYSALVTSIPPQPFSHIPSSHSKYEKPERTFFSFLVGLDFCTLELPPT